MWPVAINWENIFSEWARPPGKTEQDRCENAERVIKNAIAASDKLNRRDIKVFTQGSYRNNTNVRKDSDVDIGILCYDTFFYNLPEGKTSGDFNIVPASYSYIEFKNDVGDALINYLGKKAVKRGNKAFDIKENTYHVEADVAPFFEHRRYSEGGLYLSGVELLPDNGGQVQNWPEQHYRNGVDKNSATGRCFKSAVRILKSLCNNMADNDAKIAKEIPGFLIECLVWNVPNRYFIYSTYYEDLRACLAHIFNNTMNIEQCKEWGEVSELKYLFSSNQKWTCQQAHAFISEAWDYVGFE